MRGSHAFESPRMFEGQSQAELDAIIKTNPEFKSLYQRHKDLDKQVLDAELGVLAIDDLTLSKMKREKLMEAETLAALDSPILGFLFKDRLGQVLFGENTWSTYRDRAVPVPVGARLSAEFDFRMPILPAGQYSLDVAVANGSVLEHRQAQWIHDALVLESHASGVTTGLVGLPFPGIRLQRDDER